MYQPPNVKTLAESEPQVRVGLQSASGRGKTWSAITFPNPVVADFDNNLQAFVGRKDIIVVPFFNDAFCDSLARRTLVSNKPTARPNKPAALLNWIETEGVKLQPDQTFVADSWSAIQDANDVQEYAVPEYTKQGLLDDFYFWRNKQTFAQRLLEVLSTLRCHVVVTFHEQFISDENGKIMYNKIQPLMQGKFVNKLPKYFTDWFRCLFIPQGTDTNKLDDVLKATLVKYGVLKLGAALTSADIGLWQTKSDLVVDCKSRVSGCPQYIRADFKELMSLYKQSTEKNKQLAQ